MIKDTKENMLAMKNMLAMNERKKISVEKNRLLKRNPRA